MTTSTLIEMEGGIVRNAWVGTIEKIDIKMKKMIKEDDTEINDEEIEVCIENGYYENEGSYYELYCLEPEKVK